MRKRIYKFSFGLFPMSSELTMPMGFEILDVQWQEGVLVLWAIGDPTLPTEERFFRFYLTGADIFENPGTYIKTIQNAKGDFVAHLFESPK